MIVTIRENSAVITRESTDKKYYGLSGESLLLYNIKNALIKQGYDVIKKRMWKDGHLYGDVTLQYIRTRNKNANDFMMIYDGNYAVRAMTEDFNNGELTLNIER